MSTEIVSDPRLGIPVAPSQAVGLHMHTIALKSYRMPRQGGRRSGRDGIVHVSSRGDYLPPGGIRTGRKGGEPAAGPHTRRLGADGPFCGFLSKKRFVYSGAFYAPPPLSRAQSPEMRCIQRIRTPTEPVAVYMLEEDDCINRTPNSETYKRKSRPPAATTRGAGGRPGGVI